MLLSRTARSSAYLTERYLTTSTAPTDSQTLRLKDGRTTGYATYGPSTGKPILFFHGLPSCRLEPASSIDAIERADVRLIALDRPGFGLSTFAPKSISDYVHDVEQVSQILELETYGVLGGSGGGPFALACAWAGDQGRLRGLDKVGVLAGAPPFVPPTPSSASALASASEEEQLRQHWLLFSRLTFSFVNRYPAASQRVFDATAGLALRIYRTSWGRRATKRQMENFIRSRSSSELSDENLKEAYDTTIRLIAESFRQGTSGWLHQVKLLGSPWGFELEKINRPVTIWHGTRDVNAPMSAVRWMADKMRNAKLIESDDDHFGVATGFENVLRAIRP